MAKKKPDDGALKRLGGGRWQTPDQRFTIEPESGTWVVLDAEQTDDLGLPLVRGPFRSLAAAKAAIEGARTSEPAVSPLAAQVEEHRKRPVEIATPKPGPMAVAAKTGPAPESAKPAPAKPAPVEPAPVEPAPVKPAPVKPAPVKPAPVEPAPPAEPKWIRDLDPNDRDSAHTLIDRLAKAGVADPEGLARDELAGAKPAVAAFAIARAIERLGPLAKPAAITKLLTAGKAADLGVEWRLVDGENRTIDLD